MSKPLRVLLMGPPGGGKGTVGKWMADDFGFKVVSTGDALREAIRLDKPEGRAAQDIIKKGGLVPDEIMSNMLRSLLLENKGKSWLLDGYPRTIAQAKILDALLKELTLPLDGIFNLNVPFEIILPRVTGRLVHPQSGRVYNTEFSPPKVPNRDDVTGEPLIRRPDDEPEAVKNRLNIYAQTTAPILEYFSQRFGDKLHLLTCETSKEGYAKVKPILTKISAKKQ